MPGMSGTDVVRALRERPQTATLPVIVLTGKGDEYPLVASLGAGADDYLDEASPARRARRARSGAPAESRGMVERGRGGAPQPFGGRRGPWPSGALADTRGGRRDGRG